MKSKAKDHVQAWKESGISQREYARTNGINPNTFAYWIRKDRESRLQITSDFHELMPVSPKESFKESHHNFRSDLHISLNIGFIRFEYRRSV
jgi:transposase-like protein